MSIEWTMYQFQVKPAAAVSGNGFVCCHFLVLITSSALSMPEVTWRSMFVMVVIDKPSACATLAHGCHTCSLLLEAFCSS